MYSYHLINKFFEALKDKGFDTRGTDPGFVAKELSRLKGTQNEQKLSEVLVPLFCQRPEQESFFREILPSCIAVFLEDTNNKNSFSTQPEKPFSPLKSRIFGSLLFWVSALSLLASLLFFFSFPGAVGCTDPDSVNYNPFALKPCQDCCEENPYKGLIACTDSLAVNFNPNAGVSCDDCCSYIGCMDQNSLNYNPLARIPCPDCCDYPSYSSRADLTDRNTGMAWLEPQPLALRIPEGLIRIRPYGLFFLYKWRPAIILFLASVLLAFVIHKFFLQGIKQNRVSESALKVKAPYRYQLPVNAELSFTADPGFNNLVSAFKKHLAKSDEEVGTYYCLIEKRRDQSHLSNLFDQLCRNLSLSGVPIQRFFFYADRNIYWNEDLPEGIPAEEFKIVGTSTPVLLFSDGSGWVKPDDGSLKNEIADRFREMNLLLLSPIPLRSWGRKENVLASHFPLAPVSFAGIEVFLESLIGRSFPEREYWIAKQEKNQETLTVEQDNVLADLARYFDRGTQKWIASCALYPELSWNLTLALGAAISPDTFTKATFSDFLRIFQLSWFETGKIPLPIRSVLIRNPLLTEGDKIKVHQTIAELLSRFPPELPESYAAEKYLLQLEGHKLLSGGTEKHKNATSGFSLQLKKGLEPDLVFEKAGFLTLATGFSNKKIKPGKAIISGIAGVLLLLATFVKVPLYDRVFILPGSAELYTEENGESHSQTVEIHRFLRYLDLYALEEAEASLSTIFSEADTEDSISIADWQENLDLVYGAVYNKALELYRDNYINHSVRFVTQMHEAIKLVVANQGFEFLSLYDGFDPFEFRSENLRYLMGLSFLRLGDPNTALLYHEAIENNSPDSPDALRVPDLYHILIYEYLDTFSQGRLRVRYEGSYGYLGEDGLPVPDSLGKVFDFDFAYNFTGDKALVRKGIRYFWVDRNLNILDGYYFSTWSPAKDSLSGKIGYLDENGNWAIKPQFSEAFPFYGDLARVRCENGAMNWIKRDGSHFFNEDFEDAGDFSFGLAAAKKDGKWGYLEITGEQRIDFIFDKAGDFNYRYKAPVVWDGAAFDININGYCVSETCPERRFVVKVLDKDRLTPVPRVRFFNRIWGTYYTSESGSFEISLPKLNLPQSIRFFVIADGYTGGAELIHFSADKGEITIMLE